MSTTWGASSWTWKGSRSSPAKLSRGDSVPLASTMLHACRGQEEVGDLKWTLPQGATKGGRTSSSRTHTAEPAPPPRGWRWVPLARLAAELAEHNRGVEQPQAQRHAPRILASGRRVGRLCVGGAG